MPVKFVEIYNESCRIGVGGKDDHDESDLKMSQIIRIVLLKKDYIFVDPVDVDPIYLKQKAIEKYTDY